MQTQNVVKKFVPVIERVVKQVLTHLLSVIQRLWIVL